MAHAHVAEHPMPMAIVLESSLRVVYTTVYTAYRTPPVIWAHSYVLDVH